MSELKRIQKLVKECLLADAEVLEPDHATVVYNQILTAFKAHIRKESERLGAKMPNDSWGLYLKIGFEMYCKTIEESLEEEKG